jgi:hypothetical protein
VRETINGPVALIPVVMPDRARSFRRLRKVIGRKPVCLGRSGDFGVYTAPHTIAAAVHFRRLARFAL